MKPLYRCEYCNETGTEEEMRKHEEECINNHTKRSCLTCKHKSGLTILTCSNGQDIPEGKYFEYCKSYEWDEKDYTSSNLFGDLFGGVFK